MPDAFSKGPEPVVLHALDESALSRDDRMLAATLQGHLARRGSESLYLNMAGLGYAVWLEDLASRHGVEVRPAASVWDLVAHFQPSGYVLYRVPAELNAATTAAGVLGAVAVSEGQEERAKSLGLGLVLDVRGKTDQWSWAEFSARVNLTVAIEQKVEFPHKLRDYAVMAGAYSFFDGNSDFRRSVVEGLESDAAVLGWGDASQGEQTFVSTNSRAGVRTIPADHALNLSVLSGFTADSLQQKGSAALPEVSPGTHHVAFLMTDGDNIQWMLGDHQSDSRWWASPHRGSFNLGWGISPTLIDLAPTVMQWYYDAESTGEHNDRFVAGPSGRGYLYPGMYPASDLEVHTERLDETMARADLKAVQIIDFDMLDNTDLWASYLKRPSIDGLIYLEYSRYDRHKGKVVWVGDKPVVSVRTMLWRGISGADEASVTTELNGAVRDPTRAEGYSIVAVHAWSKHLGNIKTVVDGLGPHVKVVTPDALIGLMRKQVQRPSGCLGPVGRLAGTFRRSR